MPKTFRTYQQRGYLSRRGCQRLNNVLAECTDLYNSELQLWRDQCKETGKSDSLFERMRSSRGHVWSQARPQHSQQGPRLLQPHRQGGAEISGHGERQN